MCTLLCTESGRNVRASVRNVVPLLVTVTSARARAARSTVGALYYAPAVHTRARRDVKREREGEREGERASSG